MGLDYLEKKPTSLNQENMLEFVIGMGMVWLANLAHFGLSWGVLSSPGRHPVAGWLVLWFPVLQLVYVVPLALRARRKSMARMWGVIAASLLTLVATIVLWLNIARAMGRALR